jgi:phosphoribosylanthranilate isomerase
MEKFKIKVNGISSLTDSRYCAGMGVDVLGIIFDKNGNSDLSIDQFNAIQGWIEGAEWSGEFLGADVEIFKSLTNSYQISEWTISEELIEKLELVDFNKNRFVIKISNKDSVPNFQGSLLSYGIEIHETYLSDPKLIIDLLESGIVVWISGDFSIEKILKLNETFPNAGLILNSAKEERPGWMDLSQLQDVLEGLEEYT